MRVMLNSTKKNGRGGGLEAVTAGSKQLTGPKRPSA